MSISLIIDSLKQHLWCATLWAQCSHCAHTRSYRTNQELVFVIYYSTSTRQCGTVYSLLLLTLYVCPAVDYSPAQQLISIKFCAVIILCFFAFCWWIPGVSKWGQKLKILACGNQLDTFLPNWDTYWCKILYVVTYTFPRVWVISPEASK